MDVHNELGIIGLGNMGGNIAEVMHRNGYPLVVYDRTPDKYGPFKDKANVYLSRDMDDFAERLRSSGTSAIVWVMAPGGSITNGIISELSSLLKKGDIVIDASNSIYLDSIQNYNSLKAKGIYYLDVGCAGGPGDILEGVSLMVGGDRHAFEKAEGVFKALSGKGAYGYLGGSGSGHIAKLVHNGIFYGIFPIYAEGIEMLIKLRDSQPERGIDMEEALRLFEAAPPINAGILKAISATLDKSVLPSDAPQLKVSEMVKWESDNAEKFGVSLSVTNSVLEGYKSMSEMSRKIYGGAKQILTGH